MVQRGGRWRWLSRSRSSLWGRWAVMVAAAVRLLSSTSAAVRPATQALRFLYHAGRAAGAGAENLPPMCGRRSIPTDGASGAFAIDVRAIRGR